MASFHSLYAHGFIRAAVAVPYGCPADIEGNLTATLRLVDRAHDAGTALVVFPELGLSGYSNEDLFHQKVLLERSRDALLQLAQATASRLPLLVVGVPLELGNGLYNCAAVLHRGRILGLVPKTFLPNYREFYEKRQFRSATHLAQSEVRLGRELVPIGTDLLFRDVDRPHFCLGVEICEDLWAPTPPSTALALRGATVLANLSASNITIGKAGYRKTMAASQSGRCLAAYLYSAAGGGESTTDLAWDGHGMIWENARLLAETGRFTDHDEFITADVDLEKLTQERMRLTSFGDAAAQEAIRTRPLREITFSLDVPAEGVPLLREIERFPYVPSDPSALSERCQEAYHIQVQGLAKRLRSSGVQKVVLGVSGGLDSTHALIVAAKTMDHLSLPRKNVIACSLPGFATSGRTRTNAHELMKLLEVDSREVDMQPACLQKLKDLGHPFAEGKPLYDVTFENVQAGERTSFLFRLANFESGLVLGTGDLSELALGWCTYGVGDHMSHYNVNASVPKTLIQHLIRWVCRSGQLGPRASTLLQDILDTEISPELIPCGDAGTVGSMQRTEDAIGPYELQDFHLYYVTRYGFTPSKVAWLCHHAWRDAGCGAWPEMVPVDDRCAYDLATIKKWLRVFLVRFFARSQFKRSCVPNGPKVGSGGSLSPRGDWRAPSDVGAELWLEELDANVPNH